MNAVNEALYELPTSEQIYSSEKYFAKEVYEAYQSMDKKLEPKGFSWAYKDSKWQLTRFDTGSYFLDQL